MDNLDITERSILESERDELRFKVMQLEQTIQDAQHLFTILKYLPESVLVDIASVLEYGDKKHPGEEWERESISFHLGHAYKHLEAYLCVENIDSETGKSHLIHAIIRILMAAALEKE